LVVVSYVVFCGWLVVESGLDSRFRGNDKGAAGQSCILLQKTMDNEKDEAIGAPAGENERLEAADFTTFSADNAPAQIVTLGAGEPKTEDPDIGFKFQLELSSKGAALRKATFSNGNDNGFDNRDYKDPQPLVILSPVSRPDGGEILSMANREFIFVEHQLQLLLNDLHWKSYDVEKAEGGSQTARFEALIKAKAGKPAVKLIKTYKVFHGSYLLECKLTVENLSDIKQNVRFNLAGPVGIGREGIRGDMRNIVGGFLTTDRKIASSRKDLVVAFPMSLFTKNVGLKETTREYQEALRLRDQDRIKNAKNDLRIGRNLPRTQQDAHFLWAATSNKYFTAILRPVPDDGEEYCDWAADNTGRFYNPDGDKRGNSGDESIGVDFQIASIALAPAGQADSAKTYNFQLYLGPKDKSLFDKDPLYRKLEFVHTITFMPCCCCSESIIRPLAFGILWIMNRMYGFIHNYGVVIIILVFLMRLVMHPITKKSQVSMSKFSKLAPKVEEIKKKYANNKAEMNKQMMALYREQGASPVMGFLPMMVQMPIWIALYSAIYASIDLRGEPFLPFWITDLSAPDALFRFKAVTLPLFGKLDSFNLLPILMGVAFYLQQKLMPRQAAAATNPQMAQQQKMMMIMFPLLFPLMLYKAPSGLNLYIMASTFAGVIEQYVIRKHIREKEEAESEGLVAATSKTGGKVKKKKPKPFYKM